jgi:hypothetical protein
MEYKQLLKFPHLGPEDEAIWRKFIEQNPSEYSTVEYDVRVGEGRDYSEHPNDEYKADMIHLSKKRIDVIGFKLDEVHIIELKPKASLSAIGQVLCLKELYKRQNKTSLKIKPVIITDELLPDVPSLCLKMNILLFLAKF